MKPEQIVILSVRAVENSALSGVSELAGLPVSLSPAKGKIWFTSVRKFKGMEADAVLLTDLEVNRLKEPLMQRLVYVGASRANVYLEAAFCENDADYESFLSKNDGNLLERRAGRKEFANILGMELI